MGAAKSKKSWLQAFEKDGKGARFFSFKFAPCRYRCHLSVLVMRPPVNAREHGDGLSGLPARSVRFWMVSVGRASQRAGDVGGDRDDAGGARLPAVVTMDFGPQRRGEELFADRTSRAIQPR